MVIAEKPTTTTATFHPLEPLSADEITLAVSILKETGKIHERTRYSNITLYEPPKEAVYQYSADGPALERMAAAVLLDEENGDTILALLSLTNRSLLEWTRVEEGQASLGFEDFFGAMELVKADARWQEAMRKRGITDFDLVQVDPWIPGNFGLEVEKGHRLTRAISYLRKFPTDNGYARPIEGVMAFVDPIRKQVVEVHDYGVVPIPPESGAYDVKHVGQLRTDLKPLEITQPEGPSFTVNGHEIYWQKWRFRISMHPIEGLVLHTVGYEDDGRLRPILYRASLSEMVVPYGTTSPMHFWKNAFDSGEVGLGRCANSLELGCDCLGEIHYFDAVLVEGTGEPDVKKNAICMHEEDYGILWKHSDMHTQTSEVRRSRRLVVSAIHTVGNYEYGFFWYFYQDGTLQMEVKMTGIMQTMAVHPGERPKNAVMVAPQLAAPHHQHLFNFRLDFDIDGVANSVYEVDVVPDEDGPDNPYFNAFETKAKLLDSESSAQRLSDATKSRSWKVVNPEVKNRMGDPVGYRLVPGAHGTMFAGQQAVVTKRATFATKNLWVTPYSPFEMHAAGDFPNQHPGDDGLPAWTKADRPLENTDVVLWYTMGVTHIARPEDFPIMPCEYNGFTLTPQGFFERNPALDVPPSKNGHCHDE